MHRGVMPEKASRTEFSRLDQLGGDGFDSRRRVVFIQHKKIRSPAFRAAGVITAVSFLGPTVARLAKVAYK
jgi:hypothetical protein